MKRIVPPRFCACAAGRRKEAVTAAAPATKRRRLRLVMADTSTPLRVVLQWSPDILFSPSTGRTRRVRRRNYGFDRRRREDLRRAKQEAKAQRKTDREASGSVGPEMGEAQSTGAPEGMWEWFSPSHTRTVATAPRTRP